MFLMQERSFEMDKKQQADGIVTSHVLWSMGGGLIPLPFVDVAAVTFVELDMLEQLARLYGVDYSEGIGRSFITALAGTTLAKLGASAIKAIPGVGSLIGGLSMSILSGATAYALGQVAISQMSSGGSLMNLDLEWAKQAYQEAYERGKDVASKLEKEKDSSKHVIETLEKLGELKEKGVITEAEFEAQKEKLLDRL
jgi:uncharacterized protein (DUF697 family)